MFGNSLRNLRKERGYSLRELAAKAGIDFTYLSKIENGILPPPATETIYRLAEQLGVKADILLQEAARVPTDLANFVIGSPEAAQLLRYAKSLPPDELEELTKMAARLFNAQK